MRWAAVLLFGLFTFSSYATAQQEELLDIQNGLEDLLVELEGDLTEQLFELEREAVEIFIRGGGSLEAVIEFEERNFEVERRLYDLVPTLLELEERYLDLKPDALTRAADEVGQSEEGTRLALHVLKVEELIALNKAKVAALWLETSMLEQKITIGKKKLFIGETPSARAVCIEFERPTFTLGRLYGNPSGLAPGDLAFNDKGVPVRIEEFLSGTHTGFNFARIESAASLPSQSILTNNVALTFDFGSLSFKPSRVTFDFLDLGGSENVAVNGSSLIEGELSSGSIGGVPLTVTRTPAPGGQRGAGVLAGAVTELRLGGQEFWLDNVCAEE